MEITNIETLKKVKNTEIIKFPNFADGTELIAEIKKPSLISMVVNNRIPNSLLLSASEMVKDKEVIKNNNDNKLSVENTATSFKYMHALCKECFVSPTYDEIEEYAGGLTDEQIFFLFEYTQKGVNALKSFRTE